MKVKRFFEKDSFEGDFFCCNKESSFEITCPNRVTSKRTSNSKRI